MKKDETIYAGESQFAGWSDSHTGGPKITFWLPSSDDLDKFRALTARKGNTAGHRLMLAVVEIGEQEEPVPPPAPQKTMDDQSKAKAAIGPYCIEAIDLCRNALFHQWAEEESGVPVRSEEQAKQFVCAVLGITSRKEIDSDEEIKEAFINNIRVPFLHWQREKTEGNNNEQAGTTGERHRDA